MLMTQYLIHAFSNRDYSYSCVNLIPSSPLISWFLFMFLVIACTVCLNHITWSCTHVTSCARTWFHLTYSLGCFLKTLDLHVQIQEPRSWWPYCSWSECVIEARISDCLSRAPSFLALLIGSRDSHLAAREYFSVFLYCKSCLLRFLVI